LAEAVWREAKRGGLNDKGCKKKAPRERGSSFRRNVEREVAIDENDLSRAVATSL
jgi:hypothetical protein